MIEWLNLSDNDRILSLNQASAKSGLPVKALEKDWWVTLTLKAVFESEFSTVIEDYKSDYAQMVEQMIYGEDILDFNTMIKRLSLLNERIRKLQ